jgi:IS5 family transposase
MIKTSLFADQERKAKLNQLGDALQGMERHVDFAALAAEVDHAALPPAASAAAVRLSPPI